MQKKKNSKIVCNFQNIEKINRTKNVLELYMSSIQNNMFHINLAVNKKVFWKLNPPLKLSIDQDILGNQVEKSIKLDVFIYL